MIAFDHKLIFSDNLQSKVWHKSLLRFSITPPSDTIKLLGHNRRLTLFKTKNWVWTSYSWQPIWIVGSAAGNLPTILAWFTAHKKALVAALHTDVACGHRGNPAGSLRVIRTYATPVLAPLVLTKAKETMIELHHKEIITNVHIFFLVHLSVSHLLPCWKLARLCSIYVNCQILAWSPGLLTTFSTLMQPTSSPLAQLHQNYGSLIFRISGSNTVQYSSPIIASQTPSIQRKFQKVGQ